MKHDIRNSCLLALAGAAALLLQGCSTLTHFESKQPGAVLTLANQPHVSLPADLDIKSKSTGQHPFMVVGAKGEKLFGILPLHVNGTTMATSILFFAPALVIGGFRDSYPFYEFDAEAGVLRYRMKATDEWRWSKPSEAEAARAKAVFDRYGPAPAETAAAAAPAGAASAVN